jgi:hypothetical protein
MSQTTPSTAGPLTVVPMHGAFADAFSWTGVIERLQKAGLPATSGRARSSELRQPLAKGRPQCVPSTSTSHSLTERRPRYHAVCRST